MWLYQSLFSSLLCPSVWVACHIFAFSNDVALNKLHGYFCSAGHYLQSSVQGVSLPAWQINAHAVLLGVANFPSSKLYPQLLENICFLKVKVCVHFELITDEDWRQRMMYLMMFGSLGAKLELRSSSPESPPLSLLPASSKNWEWFSYKGGPWPSRGSSRQVDVMWLVGVCLVSTAGFKQSCPGAT